MPFNQDTQVKLLDWWARMVKDGLADNSGRKTDDAQKAFKSGKVAMNIESTGVLRSYQDAAKGKFELGTGFYPKMVPVTAADRSSAVRPCGSTGPDTARPSSVRRGSS